MPKDKPLTINFTHRDALKRILPSFPILSSHEAGWEGIQFAYYRQPTHEVPECCFTQHIISMHVGQAPARLTVKGYFQNEYYGNGELGILPAGQPSPYSHLLPHVDIMVTNGGYNGVHMALANGVPLVAAGVTEDKPEVCARVQWSGVGINLKTNKPTPMQIREAVNKIRYSSHYRQKAKLFQAEIASYDAPTLATMLLEQLAATQQPVLKEEASTPSFYPTH
jgi:hypothetical protein